MDRGEHSESHRVYGSNPPSHLVCSLYIEACIDPQGMFEAKEKFEAPVKMLKRVKSSGLRTRSSGQGSNLGGQGS